MAKITEIDILEKVKSRIADEQAEAATRPETAGGNAVIEALTANEDGDAQLFNDLHLGRFIFDHAAGVWYEWDGHSWREDVTNQAMAAISAVIEQYAIEANRQAWAATVAEKAGRSDEAAGHQRLQDALLKRIRTLRTAPRKRNVLFLATVGRGLRGDEWDRLDMVLGCKNGVIDLRTGTHRPGRPDDYIKTACPTEWRGIDEPCPIWERFLSEVFAGDQTMIDYMQRLFGYSLTGTSVLHILVILWGAGRNGKGTMLESLKHVLGEYAYKTEAEMLLQQKSTKAEWFRKFGLYGTARKARCIRVRNQ